MKARIILVAILTSAILLTGCNKGDSSDDIKVVTASPENKGSGDVYDPDFTVSDDTTSETEETRDPDETGEVIIVTKKPSGHKDSSEDDSSEEETTPTENTSSRQNEKTTPQVTYPTQDYPKPIPTGTGTQPVYTTPSPRPTQPAPTTKPVTQGTTKKPTQTTKKSTTRQVTYTVSPTVIHTMKMSEYIVFLNVGQTHKLDAIYEPSTMKVNLVWTSNRTDIATVDSKGNVKAVGTGSAIITVKDTYSGLTASCMIRI